MSANRETNATRGERRRVQTKTSILQAAEHIFAEAGFRKARIEDVATAADVSVGAIYAHFSNKEGLYLAVVERTAHLLVEQVREVFRSTASPLEQVLALGDAHLDFHLSHPGAARFLTMSDTEDFTIDPADRSRITAAVDDLVNELEATIQRAIESGEARTVDAKLISRFLWVSWNGIASLRSRRDGLGLTTRETRNAVDQARAIVLAGLRKPSAGGLG